MLLALPKISRYSGLVMVLLSGCGGAGLLGGSQKSTSTGASAGSPAPGDAKPPPPPLETEKAGSPVQVTGAFLTAVPATTQGDVTVTLSLPDAASKLTEVRLYRADGEKPASASWQAQLFVAHTAAVTGGQVVWIDPTLPGKVYSYGVCLYVASDSQCFSTPQARNVTSPPLTAASSPLAGVALLGATVAVDGDTSMASASVAVLGDPSRSGRVFVSERSGGAWAASQELPTPTGAQTFGQAVALLGTTAAVSACTSVEANGTGRVYMFAKSAYGWEPAGLVTMPAEMQGVRFGEYAVLSDKYLVVAETGDFCTDPNKIPPYESGGSLFVFERRDGGFYFLTRLRADQPEKCDFFGAGLAISGDRITASAMFKRSPTNHANITAATYVFERTGTTWTSHALTSPNAGDHSGLSMAIDHDLIAIASQEPVGGKANAGMVLLFQHQPTGAWTELPPLTEPVPQAGAYFGRSLALHGTTLVACSSCFPRSIMPPEDPLATSLTTPGSVVEFTSANGTWTYRRRRTDPAALPKGLLGWGLSLGADGTVVAGAPFETVDGHADLGKVYYFAP